MWDYGKIWKESVTQLKWGYWNIHLLEIIRMNQMKEKQRDYKAGDLRSADMKNKKPE